MTSGGNSGLATERQLGKILQYTLEKGVSQAELVARNVETDRLLSLGLDSAFALVCLALRLLYSFPDERSPTWCWKGDG